MNDRFSDLRQATADAVLRGSGTTPPDLRQSLARGEPPEHLQGLVEKIRRHASQIVDEDLDALRGRYSEDEIFEIVIAAALGAADLRLTAGLRALEQA